MRFWVVQTGDSFEQLGDDPIKQVKSLTIYLVTDLIALLSTGRAESQTCLYHKYLRLEFNKGLDNPTPCLIAPTVISPITGLDQESHI